jgi:uncharacterized protein DUF4394
MNSNLSPWLRLGAITAILLLAGCSADSTGPGPVEGHTMYAVDDSNQLREMDSENPGETRKQSAITGMVTGETMVGLDFNAVDGQLYGVGSLANLYAVDTASGSATLVGAGSFATLSGTFFGVDFNPVPNRLRLHSETGLNLRVNQLTGALAATDTALVYADGDANAGATANLVATAYTNSVVGATATTLFAIDSDLDVLVTLPSPNSGQLTTVGSLGVVTSEHAALDIAGDDGTAYAALTTGASGSALYTIDLASGQATLVGAIGGASLVGLALAP